MSIRAWQVHALGDAADVLTLGDIERPTPGPDQVRVRVRATGVNFADTLLCRGEYQVKPSPPFVPGLAEAPDPHVGVAPLAQRPRQLGDVDPGTAVDGRWVLLAEDVDAHVTSLGPKGGRPAP